MSIDQIQPDFAPLAYRHRQFGWKVTVITYIATRNIVVINREDGCRSTMTTQGFWAEYQHRGISNARRTA